MAAGEDRRERPGDPVSSAAGLGLAEFPTRQRELHLLLAEVDKALHRCGLALRRHRSDDGGDARLSALEPALDEQARDQRAGVREVASAMFSRLALRLESLSSMFARLSEQERTSVAALLRLPERDRAAIATLLGLSEQERGELSVGFRLCDGECDALAELVAPSLPAAELDNAARPTIAIVDGNAEADDAAVLSAGTDG